jgi:tetratricopeptide (TPR) repeat protein
MRKRILALAIVGAGLVVWASIGWDAALWDPRLQLALHLLAALAIGGLVVFAARGGETPRTPLDLPIAGLLIAFGVATLSAWNVGLSAPALAGIVATAAMLPVALVALRHRPDWTAVVVVAPIIVLTAATLVAMVGRRIEWLLAGGTGWPPVRLPNELTSFGPVAVPPFVILAALPVALVVTQPRLRRAMVAALLVIGVPLTVLSGSRSAWIAIAVAVSVLAVSRAGSLQWIRRPSPRQLATVLAGVGLAALAIAFVGSRLRDISSLGYRTQLWDATLAVWRGDPWLGIGPGAMPYARQTVAPLLQPHSHDVPLGILGDAGIVGLIAALVVFVVFVWVARPRAESTAAGRVAFAVLIGIAIGFLGEDLTFLPAFNLLLILAAAAALLDARAVTWRRTEPRIRVAAPAFAAMAGLAVCGLLADAAAVSFHAGTEAAAIHDWPAAEDGFSLAVALDPLQPSGPKALAIAADWNGHPAVARQMAQRAVELNSGDSSSWTNLAVLCLAAGDRDCASRAADSALRASANSGLSLINAARVYAATGQAAKADAAYLASLQKVWQTALVVQWPHRVPLGDDFSAERGAPLHQLSLLLARRIQEEPLRPAAYASASVRAVAFAMLGDTASARLAVAEAIRETPDDVITWDLVALLRRYWGEDDALALRVGAVTRGGSLSSKPAAIVASTRDIAALRAIPADGLVSGAQRLLSPSPWPWVLEPLLAPSSPVGGGG